MGILDDIGDFVKATAGEIGHHPLQAAGAAFGVPGYDPFFGGLFNNHKGGALLSPTGNFTSSAWGEMYKDNPNATNGLDLFHRLNSVADIVAPAMAGGYASGVFSGGGGGLLDGFGMGGTASPTAAAGGAPRWLNYARLGMNLLQQPQTQQQSQMAQLPVMYSGRPGGAYGAYANGGRPYSLLDVEPPIYG